MKASKIMENRVRNTTNIKIHWNTETEEILGENMVEGVNLKNVITGEVTTLKIQGFFVAIGHQPNSEVFTQYLDSDSQGYLLTQPDSTKTNIEGVFACGDVQDKNFRQAVTAAGSGCMAALEAERYLMELESVEVSYS
jgi:thioredoxin reductase (NADPH)